MKHQAPAASETPKQKIKRSRAERVRDTLVKMRFDEFQELADDLAATNRGLARTLVTVIDESLNLPTGD